MGQLDFEFEHDLLFLMVVDDVCTGSVVQPLQSDEILGLFRDHSKFYATSNEENTLKVELVWNHELDDQIRIERVKLLSLCLECCGIVVLPSESRCCPNHHWHSCCQ